MVRVGDVSQQIRGVTYSSGEAVASSVVGHLPILRANNISENGLNLDDLVYVPGHRISERQLLRIGDVVIVASSGSLNVVGRAAAVISDFHGSFGAFCKVLRPNALVDPAYFAQFFKTANYRRRISSAAAGLNINNIRNEDLDGLEIPLPPLDEQRRIAAILDQADDLRRIRRVALEKLNVLAGAIFFDLFGDPVQNLHKWPVKTLDKLTLGNPNNGIFKKNHEYLADARTGIPVVWVEDLFRGHKVGLTTARTLAASPRDVETFGLRNGDVLFCRSSLKLEGIAYTNVFLGPDNAALFECHIVRISPDREQVSPMFLNWQLRLPSVRNIAKQKSKTSTMTTIDQRAILSIPVVVPPISLQIEFERRLEAVFNAAESGMKQLSGCDRLFVSLQHRAFHGQLLSSRPATAPTV